ncbi:MAG TPA: tail fiber protein, partial [Polyangia bacterium]|nr:tail fiber protein [Polyangia bacterium]
MGEGLRRMRQKRVYVAAGLSLAVVVTAGAAVLGSVPHSFTAGETLTAANLNSDFAALDQRIAALEAGLPSGSIVPYGGPSGANADAGTAAVPAGWLLCDGSAVSRTTYASLFAAIGINFGGGDGITTFNLPDLRGRTIIGAGHGTGLTARTLGQTVGEETHTLSTSEMPAHSHTLTDPGHTHTTGPTGNPQAGQVALYNSTGTCGLYCGTQEVPIVMGQATSASSTTGIT